MSPASDAAQIVPSISDLVTWVFAKVDSSAFEEWKESTLRRNNRIVLKTSDGINLWAKLDLYHPESPPDKYLYVDAKHRINFDFMFRETCRCWEGGRDNRPGIYSENAKIAFAKIGYKGVVWQLS